MKRYLWFVATCAAAGLTLACDSPVDPGPLERPIGGVGFQGSTLKVSPPSPLSPRAGEVADSVRPTLLTHNAHGFFVPDLPVRLVFEVFDQSNARVYRSDAVPQHPSNQTSHVVAVTLASGRTYSWRVTAVLDGRATAPSAPATFQTP